MARSKESDFSRDLEVSFYEDSEDSFEQVVGRAEELIEEYRGYGFKHFDVTISTRKPNDKGIRPKGFQIELYAHSHVADIARWAGIEEDDEESPELALLEDIASDSDVILLRDPPAGIVVIDERDMNQPHMPTPHPEPARDPWYDDPANQQFMADLDDVLREVKQMLISKRRGYGPPSNLLRFGEMGIVIRTSDKLDRLSNFIQHGEGGLLEGKTDAWRDIIGYGVLGLMNDQGMFR